MHGWISFWQFWGGGLGREDKAFLFQEMGGGVRKKRIKGEMWGEEFGREVEREDWMGVKEQGRVGRLGRIGEIGGGGGGGRQVMISFGGEGVREGEGERLGKMGKREGAEELTLGLEEGEGRGKIGS